MHVRGGGCPQDGSTALHCAANAGDEASVHLLVEKNADINAVTTVSHAIGGAGHRLSSPLTLPFLLRVILHQYFRGTGAWAGRG